MNRNLISATIVCGLLLATTIGASAALLTDPNDPRSWQGATVGTFADLYYGADTPANRQLVIDNNLLDDGTFDFTGATPATMIANSGGAAGTSLDTTGTGSYAYSLGGDPAAAGSTIDNTWVQTNNVIGDNVWDLGGDATKAAIFNTIDHGPLPLEAIESTAYLSNDLINWTQAVTERVWLEGFESNLGILWDGFAYAVGTGSPLTFRYVSIIWGGPGGLQADGDNEINGVLGLNTDFTPIGSEVPLPAALPLFLCGLAGLNAVRRRKSSRTKNTPGAK